MENLKKNGKYEEYKQKKAVSRKKLRESKKEEESKLSPTQTAKMVVRKHIRARDCIVNSANDFVSAFHRTESSIAIEEVTEDDFKEINTMLRIDDVFKTAKNICEIASSHQIQVINKKIHAIKTSNEGYKI